MDKQELSVYVFNSLLGKVLAAVEPNGKIGTDCVDRISFKFNDGETWEMFHIQDCCENVAVNDIEGDLSTLLGEPLLVAEKVSKECEPHECSESGTWTFYRFATRNGFVVIRWLGESNGYYSESVSFEATQQPSVTKSPNYLRMGQRGEVSHLTIYDSGDPSTGLSPTTYKLTGSFVFYDLKYLEGFESGLINLLDEYGFIQGSAKVSTDVEEQALAKFENANISQ